MSDLPVDMWRDHVVIDLDSLAVLLGVDPKAHVLRVWDDRDADWLHLLAAAPGPIEPGQQVASGGTTDSRVVRLVRYEPRPSRFHLEVNLTIEPSVLHDRETGQVYVLPAGRPIPDQLDTATATIDRLTKEFCNDKRRDVDVDAVGIGMAAYQELQARGWPAHRAPTPVALSPAPAPA